MLEYLEALAALARTGTMGAAGAQLRVGQSAVSKRVAALETIIGAPLIERDGRRAVLTPRAEKLLARAMPAVAEMRAAFSDDADSAIRGRVLIGVSESILASWGAGVLRRSGATLPEVELVPHAHRSPVVAERVAAGEYALGLVAGLGFGAGSGASLVVEEIAREPMALIQVAPSKTRDRRPKSRKLITIEERSGTWEAIARRANALGLKPTQRVESFFAAAAMAQASLGEALVPLGVCTVLKVPKDRLKVFGPNVLSRPVSLVVRRGAAGRAVLEAVRSALRRECEMLRWGVGET